MAPMTPALEQIVREAVELTGAATPEVLSDDAPVLSDDALAAGDDAGFYVVGLIGGKDVGKSALINALVGKPITAVTSTGAGTETVIAYAHVSQREPLRALLEREAAGQFRIVTHDLASLKRQVLLDLPDIDSKYLSHLQLTRTMLRHMLFPVWVGSIEKYADQQPQQMLARVAEGNTPGNFVFCLNKVDQLERLETKGVGPRSRATGFREEEEEAAVATATVASVAANPWGLDLEEDTASASQFDVESRAAKSSPSVNAQTRSLPASTPLAELRDDYADRLARTLKLPASPRVFMISAKYPARHDMPALRELLSRQKSADAVRESKQQAIVRQDRTLLAWLDQQHLSLRASRLAQLQKDAEDLIADRIGGPILERIVPRLLDDPAARLSMADDILQERVARWPVVNLVHTLLQPVFVLLRSAVSRGATPMQSPDAQVDAVVKDSRESIPGLVQSTFAQLRQSQPGLAAHYPHNKLWEDMPAALSAANLQRALAQTVERQRAAARRRLLGRGAMAGAPFRWLLTIGALLWFPFIQPVLSVLLVSPDAGIWRHWRNAAGLLVSVLGVDYLLKSAGFLIIYYAALWLALRWNTQRQVGRLLGRWRATDFPDATVNLAAQTLLWIEDLTAPVAAVCERMTALAERAEAVKEKIVRS
ncbi:MAG TPA: GTPase [Tepidisphaeraceae bacterium]|nr:GTPase [Tepidisphaeraceae bacterium]